MIVDSLRVASPIGPLTLFTREGTLVAVDFGDGEHARRRLEKRFGAFAERPSRDAARVGDRLARYLAGELRAIDDVAVDPGGTEFQRAVWKGLRDIPAGEARSYGELARAIGRKDAARAVGMANHDNPIPIVIPCHRVIGADGSLTGYGGGLPIKRWLLEHEGIPFRDN
jgi:methylated-DNA-[protein]-cysteine S-methyltransferase